MIAPRAVRERRRPGDWFWLVIFVVVAVTYLGGGYLLQCVEGRLRCRNLPTHTRHHVNLHTLVLHSGDLILFRSQRTPLQQQSLNNSYFTHVGLVYQDPHNHEWYVLESHPYYERIRVPLRSRVAWYQQTEGPVAVRRLRNTLRATQKRALDAVVREQGEQGYWQTAMNDDRVQSTHVDPAFDARIRTWCIRAHLLSNAPPIRHAPRMLCTDFVAFLLQRAQVLDARRCYSCLKPDFFENEKLNRYVCADSVQYEDQLLLLSPLAVSIQPAHTASRTG